MNYAVLIVGAAFHLSVAAQTRPVSPKVTPPSQTNLESPSNKPTSDLGGDFKKALIEDAKDHREFLEKTSSEIKESANRHKEFMELAYKTSVGLLMLMAGLAGWVLKFLNDKTIKQIRETLENKIQKTLADQIGDKMEEVQAVMAQAKDTVANDTKATVEDLQTCKHQVNNLIEEIGKLKAIHAEELKEAKNRLLDMEAAFRKSRTASNEAAIVITLLYSSIGASSRELAEVAIEKGRAFLMNHSTQLDNEMFRYTAIPLGRAGAKHVSANSGIGLLNEAIAMWMSQERGQCKHYAAMLYNKACYLNRNARSLLSSKPEDAEDLTIQAKNTLIESCRIDPDNRNEALTDSDLFDILDALGSA